MIFLYIIGALLVIILLIFARKLLQLKSGNRRLAKEIAAESQEKLGDIGQVSTLSILPLIDFHTSDSRLKTEPGVSYQVRAGDTTILLDVGFNKKKEHPSALLNNAEVLGVNFQNLDAIFISHLHLDHVGGMAEQHQGQFSFSQGPTTLPEIPVYVPVPISPSHYNPKPEPRLISRPQKLAEGIASIGTIPRNLFLLGYTLEHSLAVNVAGKGIVLVIG